MIIEFFKKIFGKEFNSTYVKNADSNNITNWGKFIAASINNGHKEINGNEINIINMGDNSPIVLNVDGDNPKSTTLLSNDIKKIKESDNNTFSEKTIEKYKELLIINAGTISEQDKFEIILNILIIYVNRNDKEHIEQYIKNIEKLSFKDDERVKKVISVYYFNSGDFKRTEEILSTCELKISHEPQYIMYLVVQCINNKISYAKLKETLLSSNEFKIEFKPKNASNLYNILACSSKEKKEYYDLIVFAKKSVELNNSASNRANLAMAYYLYSIKDSVEDEKITGDKINYEELIKSKTIIEDVINIAKNERNINLFEYSMQLYIQVLGLLGKSNDALDILRNLSFQDKNDTLIETQNFLECIFGNSSDKALNREKMNESDLLLKEIHELINNNDREAIINRLEPIIWNQYKNELRFHCILLNEYLDKRDFEKFISHIKRLDSIKEDSNFLFSIKFKYYSLINDVSNAEKFALLSIDKYKDPVSYCELLSLYLKNREDTKFELLIKRIFDNDNFVLEVNYKEVYNLYFNWLLINNKILEAKKVIDNCNEDKYGITNYIKIKGEIYSKLEDWPSLVDICKKGYQITNDPNYLYNLSGAYMQCNNINEAEKYLTRLLNTNFENKEIVYSMLSNIAVLKNNLDLAFEYCEKAKEIVKDLPKSPIHQFYVARSLRCNKIDSGFKHMGDFMENYPKIDDWVKPINVLEQDDDGHKKLTKEVEDFFKKSSNRFNTQVKQLKSGSLGFVNIAVGQMYDNIFSWKDIYNIKVNVNSGDIEEIEKEKHIKNNSIVIDVIGLYILSDIGELNLLKNLNSVYITYSTIEYLNTMLLHNENENVRDILKFIKSNLNIITVTANHRLSNLFDKIDQCLDKCILDSLYYAQQNNITYYYGEHILKLVAGCYNINTAGIMALVQKENIERRSIVISRLRTNNFKFINFNYMDIYYCAKRNNFKKCKELECFFDMDDGGDISSFFMHYLLFIYIVYKKHNEYFQPMYELFIQCINKIYSKTIYSTTMLQYLDNSNKAETYDNLMSLPIPSNLKDNVNNKILTVEEIELLKVSSIAAIQYSYTIFKTGNEFRHYLDIISKKVNIELFNQVRSPNIFINRKDTIKYFDAMIKDL